MFGAIVAARRRFHRHWRRPERLRAPVVVVGNLIVGGAGKTPTVIATVAALRRAGWRPGIVSRGYRGEFEGLLDVRETTPAACCGDEPLLLRRRTGAPVVVGADRVAAARQLLADHPEVDVIVADDGLQHLALARDAQIIVFDERGAGNGRLLPAGPLREPMPHAVPPRTIVVYNAAVPSTAWPGVRGERRIAAIEPLAAWAAGSAPNAGLPPPALRGRPVHAAAGLARPDRFFAMLRALGLEIVPLALPDHHDFGAPPWPPGTTDVIVTEKDAVKLDPSRVGATRVWVAPLDFRLEPRFDAALAALLPPPAPLRHGNAPA